MFHELFMNIQSYSLKLLLIYFSFDQVIEDMSIQANVPALAMEEVIDLLLKSRVQHFKAIVGGHVNFNLFDFDCTDCTFGSFRCSHVGS